MAVQTGNAQETTQSKKTNKSATKASGGASAARVTKRRSAAILLAEIESANMKKDTAAEFAVGDTVKVHAKIKEGEKERVQIFEGVVIAMNRRGLSRTFTVRKIAHGVGVERVFPLHSSLFSKVEIVSRGEVRRSKLYYVRDLKGKAARIKPSKSV